jgi:hypothetical protein
MSARGVKVSSITEITTATGSSSSARGGWGVEVGNFDQEEDFLGDAKAEGV